MTTLKFKSNIKCSGCIATVTPLLDAETSIDKWEVDIFTPAKILTITTEETDVDKITKLVEDTVGKAGFKIEEI